MGFLDHFKKEPELIAVRSGKSGSHGSHWDTVVESEEIRSRVSDALMHPQRKDYNNKEPAKRLTGWFRGDEIQTCLITGILREKNEILSAYPFIRNGMVHEITARSIDEWNNGFESQVTGNFTDASISFFDTLYFTRRFGYPKERSVKVELGAFAYAIRPSKLDPVKLEDGTVREFDPDFCGYFPFTRGDIDDFEFISYVKEIRKTTFEGKSIYRIVIPLCKQDFSGTRTDVDIPLYVSERTLNGYLPREGERISGILWMQGHRV